jgi:hypothetical protein
MRPLRLAASEIVDIARATTTTHRRLRGRLVVIAVATPGLNLLCAGGAFLLERHAQQTAELRQHVLGAKRTPTPSPATPEPAFCPPRILTTAEARDRGQKTPSITITQ